MSNIVDSVISEVTLPPPPQPKPSIPEAAIPPPPQANISFKEAARQAVGELPRVPKRTRVTGTRPLNGALVPVESGLNRPLERALATSQEVKEMGNCILAAVKRLEDMILHPRPRPVCALCDAINHPTVRCRRFVDPPQRIAQAMNLQICLRCGKKDCNSLCAPTPCACGGPHVEWICPRNPYPARQVKIQTRSL